MGYHAGSDYEVKLMKLEWHLERARSYGNAVTEFNNLLRHDTFFQVHQEMELVSLRRQVKRGDTYVPLWDFWQDGYGLRDRIGEGGDKLIAAYTKEVAVRKARQFAKSKGWSYSEKVDAQTQQTIITLRKY